MTRGDPVCRKEDCSPFDIGLVFQQISSLQPEEKFRFIENVWKPGEYFDFPLSVENGKSRKFVWGWCKRFPWIVYSKYLDGVFCLPCVFFGRNFGRNSAKLSLLFKSPLTCWTFAATRLTKHGSGSCEIHNFAVGAMNDFLTVMRRRAAPINLQLNNLVQQQIAKNREILKSLFKTIIFCGCNNIPLRGQRDDDPGNPDLVGNFVSLLSFRVESGDEVLREHLETAPRNARYISKTIQNEMISTVGAYILNNLSGEIRRRRFFSILADEAADISNKENLSIVIRYFSESCIIREVFVGYYLCEGGTTGEAIKDIITSVVADLGLSMDDCRGQCYDGSGNMAGRLNGASSLILNEHEKAIYVHCMSHRLNLCIANTCEIILVKNMMTVVRKISEFFNNSPKRQLHLISKIKELMPDANHRVLIDVCRTRWIERIDGMDRIVELLLPVMATLEDIALNRSGPGGDANWNHNSRNDAQALINSVTFSFIVTLVIVKYILGLTRPLTVKLQQRTINLLKAKDEMALLKDTLNGMQADIDNRHHDLYIQAVDLASEISVDPCMPRITQRQVHRNNAPAQTPETYYRINLTRVFLDHVLQQLNTRFQDDVFVCYKGLSIIPSILLATNDWKRNVVEFCDHYRDDIPNYTGLEAELTLWERLWERKQARGETIPDTLDGAIELTDMDAYVNIGVILLILITIPITSASCERSISTLRYLKNYLRNTMTQDRLNGLALMYSHRTMELDLDEIIDLFASLHPRRMRMEAILE